jgi:hypothetical protein
VRGGAVELMQSIENRGEDFFRGDVNEGKGERRMSLIAR